MATFRKRKTGVQVQIRIKGTAPLSATFPTMKQAKDWALHEEFKAKKGKKTPHTKTLKELLAEYARIKSPLSQHSKNALKNTVRLNCLDKDIRKLTVDDALEAKELYLKTLSPPTAARYLRFVRCALEYGRVEDNPFKGILIAKDRERWVRFTDSDYKQFVNVCESKLLKDFIQFALETAMRRGEIINIKKQDIIDLDTIPKLYIPFTKIKKPRTIPLTKKALAILQQRLEISDIPFDVDPGALSRAFRLTARRAGLHDKRLHDLRHEALSRLSSAGLNAPQLMQISGHTSLKSLGIYTNGTVDELAMRINQLDTQSR